MVDVPGNCDDRVRRSIHRSPEAPDRLRREGANALLVAADLAPERAGPEHCLLEQRLSVLGRVVKIRADLLDDDGPLSVDLLLVEVRPNDQLTEDVHGPDRLAPRDANPVNGGLAIRGSV